ncbi:unnamed protein product [Aphanomyces euteiches]|uniref:CHCH domain-containing protein n=1 Tax=Aphanomyces euteiches TaxID=100861 RepID=A0A6G0X2I1_9STRA|nr:hypothetical protein Ae201684_009214 [Aphanomyces euteiches]KAH9070040.1 hypothetical protein Ae201684P_002412 [Aphanomyces euteiches]KAH9133145.1 hypothetical protein AeRB84_020699 [Aphanomyces euteiches]
MARSRSSPTRRSAPAAKPAASAPAVKPAAPAPVQAAPQQSGGMTSGLLGTVAQGMAFGTGSVIAHRAVGAVANSFGGSDKPEASPSTAAAPPTSTTTAAAPSSDVCFNDHKAFLYCLQGNKNDVGSCQFYFDKYNMCKSNQSSSFASQPEANDFPGRFGRYV